MTPIHLYVAFSENAKCPAMKYFSLSPQSFERSEKYQVNGHDRESTVNTGSMPMSIKTPHSDFFFEIYLARAPSPAPLPFPVFFLKPSSLQWQE